MGEEREEQVVEVREEYFLDTSAVIELIGGNEKYREYLTKRANITLFNLAEIYWIILNKIGEKEAEKEYSNYKDLVLEITDEIIKEAMKFRKQHKNKGFSYADSIGYMCAKKNNLKFLTSDSQFKDMDNVDFVK